jgi:nicotinamide-nucleotide amidase
MDELIAAATAVGARLTARGERVAVAESSAGGLIAAALLAVPGASAYFAGGAVVYTGAAKERLVGVTPEDMAAGRAATEPHALILARRARLALEATWGIGETGAAGPTGNRYGDPAGHACVGVSGPIERAATVATGHPDRAANMHAFALAALRLLDETLAARQRE